MQLSSTDVTRGAGVPQMRAVVRQGAGLDGHSPLSQSRQETI